MAGRFSVETIFTAIDRISRPVLRMAGRVRRATDSMARGFKKVDAATNKLLGSIRSIGTRGVAALGLVAVAMGRVIGKGADFEQTLVNAAVKFPGALELGADDFKTSLKELSDVARATGRTTEFTALQAAGAINFLATAGFNAEQAIASLPGVVDLATAAQIDLATASDIATDALGAFNLMTDDSAQLSINLARINDVLAKTATSANVTIQTMFETMKDGAPVATSAGVSLETFAAFTGVLGSSMIKGSKAGTTLKNVVLSLSAPSKEAAKVLKRLTVSTEDSEGNFRNLIDILGDLNGSLAAVGTTARTAQLDAIFGKIPIAGVNILLSAGAERLREYTTEIENAGGATGKMAGIMRNTVRGSINALNSAVESVSLTMFAMNSGPLKETIDRLTDWVRANEKLIATNLGEFMLSVLNNLEAIVLAARQITGVVVGLIAFSIAVKAIGAALVVAKVAFAAFAFISAGLPTLLFAATVAMGALNIAMFANPVGLIVAGVTALVGIAALVIAAWGPVTKFFGEMFDMVTGVISPALSLFGFSGDGDDGADGAAAAANVSSPQGRAAASIQETISTSTATLNIAGAPEGSTLSTKTPTPGINLQLANSGGF